MHEYNKRLAGYRKKEEKIKNIIQLVKLVLFEIVNIKIKREKERERERDSLYLRIKLRAYPKFFF